MHRFFADKSQFTDTSVTIVGDDVKHIARVLRLKPGDKISVCDKEKTDYVCSVNEIGKDFVTADIMEKSPNNNESNLSITLYQGFPKGDKLDLIIQKSVELGVVRIVPVVMKRTVVKLKNSSDKSLRRQRIAEEAAKQCMRGIIPEVGEPIDFKQMIASISGEDLSILPYENENDNRLKSLLADNPSPQRVNIIIGPEGGFDEEEIKLAEENGIHCVTLGPRILRCETAPLAAISAVMYELGDW